MHISNIFDSNRLLETLIRHFSIYKYEYRLLGYSRYIASWIKIFLNIKNNIQTMKIYLTSLLNQV